MRPRLCRPLFAFGLFAALLWGACGLALVPVSLKAQEAGKDSQAKDPAVEDTRPVGDDALFAPLPAEGLHQGVAPTTHFRAVLIDVPFEDSWQDDPLADLPESARLAAQGLRLALEQRLDYLPGVFQYLPQADPREYLARVRGYAAALRFSDVRVLKARGKSDALEGACARFDADVVFAVAYARGAETPPAARVIRYQRGKGATALVDVPLAKPSGRAQLEAVTAATQTLCGGLAVGPDGKELPHAPVPAIAADDVALKLLAQMTLLFMQGELAEAWVKYEDLRKRDAANGRAALYAMQMFAALAGKQTDVAERDAYVARVMNTGREGLAAAPNDVILRGRLCRQVSIWFRRDVWCLAGLAQALKVQPANVHLLDWYVNAQHPADRLKQAQWLQEHALGRMPRGCAEFLIGLALFGSGDYAGGTKWYAKAHAAAPREYEYAFGLGMCATYLGESLFAKARGVTPEVIDAYATAADALVAAQRIDPTPMGWLFEFHPRAATQSFRRLPVNPDDLERVMLSQAVVTGLQPTGKTVEWDRLVQPVIVAQRKLLRETAAEAKPGHPDYEIWLMARLKFADVDGDKKTIVETLKLMRRIGHRSPLYEAMMEQFAALLE